MNKKRPLTPDRVVRPALIGLAAVLALHLVFTLLRSAPPLFPKAPDHPVLNEACGEGQTILDAGSGTACGWVELYNPTDKAVSLKGWSLSGKKTELHQYDFPEDSTIAPGGYLLVYCVGGAEEDEPAAVEQEGTLLARFRLSRGKTLCLSRNGSVVDTLTLPQTLQTDTCFGRVTDGGSTTGVLSATPGDSNHAAERLALVEKPEFSQQSGFYDNSFSLTITAPKGCTVYYTLDSSVPTTDSTPYTEPLTIEDVSGQPNRYCTDQNQAPYSSTPLYEGQKPVYESYYAPYLVPEEPVDKCTVVRAVAVDKQGNVSDVETASYFVGYQHRSAFENVSVLSLVSEPEGLFGDSGILTAGGLYKQKLADGSISTSTYWVRLQSVCNFFQKGSSWERPTHLDYFEENGQLSFSQEAGIRVHGNASRRRVPKSFSLYARSRYDGNDLFQKSFFSDGLLTDKVFLVNGAAARRFLLVSQMDSRTMDTQNYHLIQLFLDGEYWGFYAVQEPYNSSTYLHDHYGLDEDDALLVKSDSRELVPVTGTAEDIKTYYDPLMEFAASHDLSQSDNWAELNTMMDVQSFIDFYAAELYLCNSDFNWHQNIYLYKSLHKSKKNPYADGRWHWMFYDADYSSGVNSQVPADLNLFTAPFLNKKYSLAKDPLFPHLMKNTEFRTRFVNTYLDLANDVYGAEEMSELVGSFKERWAAAAYASVLRYPQKDDADTLNPETRESRFTSNCDKLAQFFRDRFGYAVPYMADYCSLTGKQVTVTLQGAPGGTISLNTLTPDLSQAEWSGIYYTDVPVTLSAQAEPGMVFDRWEVSSGTLEDAASPETTLSLREDTTVTAVFRQEDAP